MNNRLEVTLFGTQYSVGALRMNRKMVAAGMEAYGPGKWEKLITDIALEPKPKKRIADLCHTIGHTVEVVYNACGIVMQEGRFGLEVFHGGTFFPVDAVGAENKILQPSLLMKGYKAQDMLSVFWARREGVMSFRWDDVDELNQEDISLVYDGLAPMLASRRPFDLTLDVLWRGKKGKRVDVDRCVPFESLKHVFHMTK